MQQRTHALVRNVRLVCKDIRRQQCCCVRIVQLSISVSACRPQPLRGPEWEPDSECAPCRVRTWCKVSRYITSKGLFEFEQLSIAILTASARHQPPFWQLSQQVYIACALNHKPGQQLCPQRADIRGHRKVPIAHKIQRTLKEYSRYRSTPRSKVQDCMARSMNSCRGRLHAPLERPEHATCKPVHMSWWSLGPHEPGVLTLKS